MTFVCDKLLGPCQDLCSKLVMFPMPGMLCLWKGVGGLLIQPGELVGYQLAKIIISFTTAGEYIEEHGDYVKRLDEHFFLTDPEEFSFSHFPFMETDPHYDRWQLVGDKINLQQFNTSSHLSSTFFELGLALVEDIPTPWVVQDGGVIRIKSWDVILYKVSP